MGHGKRFVRQVLFDLQRKYDILRILHGFVSSHGELTAEAEGCELRLCSAVALGWFNCVKKR